MCRDAKLFYDTLGMQGKGLSDGAHMRRTIRYLNDCGHEIALLARNRKTLRSYYNKWQCDW